MSRSTPRKSRHRNHLSGGGGGVGSGSFGPRQVAASDYESDAVQYMEARDAPPMQPRINRTNTDLNISVLSRYLPGIRSILSIAASSTVFLYSVESQCWKEYGVVGPLFVVERDPIITPSGQTLTQVCVFVLNRRALENFMVDLVKVSDCELHEEMISFRLEEDDEGSETEAQPKVIGIWIHADEEHTRDVNMTIIRGAWQQARLSWNSLVQEAAAAGQAQRDNNGATLLQPQTAPPAEGASLVGRQISIADLFGQGQGPGQGHGHGKGKGKEVML